MFESIGIIGAGRIATILLEGWRRSQTPLPAVRVFDRDEAAASALQQAYATVELAGLEQVACCDLLLLAVHPPVVSELLPRLAGLLQVSTLLCSLAPRIRIPELICGLSGHDQVARINPNAPSIIGAGFNPVAFAQGVTPERQERLKALFAPLGQMPQVPDEQIETYAVISAMGPTYFWFQFHTMSTMAQSFGLGTDEAVAAMRSMLHGAVDTLFAGSLSAQRVMDLVPIRPMAEEEGLISELISGKLATIYGRLTG